MKVHYFLITTLLSTIAGCTPVSKAEFIIKEGVELYCKVPPTGRHLNRALVNEAIAPNKIEITCAD